MVLLELNVEKLAWVIRRDHPIDWAAVADVNPALTVLDAVGYRVASWMTCGLGITAIIVGIATLANPRAVRLIRALLFAAASILASSSVALTVLIAVTTSPYDWPGHVRSIAGLALAACCAVTGTLVAAS
jgi:hypothetical protein